MSIPLAHLSALRERLDAILAPISAHVISVEEPDQGGRPKATISLAQRMIRAKMGPGVDPVRVRLQGWGRGFEAHPVLLRTGLNPNLPADVAAAAAVVNLQTHIRQQVEYAVSARLLGIDAPLAGDLLLDTDHLLVDVDGAATLVDHCGSKAGARAWVDAQMRQRRMGLEGVEVDLLSDVVGRHFDIHYRLKPLRPESLTAAQGIVPQWSGTTVILPGSVPEITRAALHGLPLWRLVEDTPIGHRIVDEVDGGSDMVFTSGPDTHLIITLISAYVPLRGAFA